MAPLTLERRIRDLVRDIAVAEQLLGGIDQPLRDRVALRMKTEAARLTSETTGLQQRAASADADLRATWAELHALSYEVDDLLEECSLLLAGAAERSLGVDGGHCRLADALVDELVAGTPIEHWGSFTVLGRSEQYAHASRAIQVRFPASSIWDLPIVAHELGHFVGPALIETVGLRTEHPLDELFADLGDGTEESWSWLQELFADAFAAYVLGPAYGFSAAVVVLDPLLAAVATDTHPPAHQRMQLIASALSAADSREGAHWAERVVRDWHHLVIEAGGPDGLELLDESPFAERLIQLIQLAMPVSGWTGWESARAVASVLEGATTAAAIPVPTVADILNGAWIARVRSDSTAAIDQAGHKALTWIRSIVEGTS